MTDSIKNQSFFMYPYFFTPGLLSYPAVKIAVKNAKLTPSINKNPIVFVPPKILYEIRANPQGM